MLNNIVLIGRLTRDPELRYTPSGVAVTKIALAVDRGFTNKQGEKETDFIDVVVWQKLAENCASYLDKGRLVAVEGRLQIRSYEDKEGIRRKAAEVVARNVKFLDKAKDGSQNGKNEGKGNENGSTKDFVNNDWDEDCPF